jgi:hypothetical protein
MEWIAAPAIEAPLCAVKRPGGALGAPPGVMRNGTRGSLLPSCMKLERDFHLLLAVQSDHRLETQSRRCPNSRGPT